MWDIDEYSRMFKQLLFIYSCDKVSYFPPQKLIDCEGFLFLVRIINMLVILIHVTDVQYGLAKA